MREWNPPALDPASSAVVRRSTTVASTPANASSPASIMPAGPLPTTITSAMAIPSPPRLNSVLRSPDFGGRRWRNSAGGRPRERA